MSAKISVAFFLAHPSVRVLPGDAAWNAALPMDRHGQAAAQATWRLGDYLAAIADRLLSDDAALLGSALEKQRGHAVPGAAIDTLQIFQEKHGAFYHPVRLRVRAAGRWHTLCLTAAFSAPGRSLLIRECQLLRRLQRLYPSDYLPRIYQEATLNLAGQPLPLFLSEWFSGFHEFHLSAAPAAVDSGLRLWHATHGRLPLSTHDAAAIYRQTAAILTHFYDPTSYAQIFPWHHAAGDFVARLGRWRPSVRLITVRQHAPMIEPEQTTAHAHLEALWFFLLNLTIRNRLDRLDGVGEIAWADDYALHATLQGFWQALSAKQLVGQRTGELARAFRGFLAEVSQADLQQGCEDLLAAANPRAPDTGVIARHLTRHVEQCARLLFGS